jgi:hypothetical protein
MDLGGSGVGQIAVYPVLVKKVQHFSYKQYLLNVLCADSLLSYYSISGHDFGCTIWSWQH